MRVLILNFPASVVIHPRPFIIDEDSGIRKLERNSVPLPQKTGCGLNRSLVAACNRVPGSSQVFSQFCFHLDRSVKGHWIQMFVKLWHQSDAIFSDYPRRFVAVLVILEPVVNRNSRHSNIDAGLRRISLWVKAQDRGMLCDSVLQQNNVNVMVK
jgi:hypothetical protein